MKEEARRTMSEALRTVELPAAAIALIKEGAVKVKATMSAPPSPLHETSSPERGQDGDLDDHGAARSETDFPHAPDGPGGTRVTKAKSGRDLEPEPTASAGCVSLTVRVPADLPTKLLRAATDRKIAKQRPSTQQGMVSEALAQWLKKNGY